MVNKAVVSSRSLQADRSVTLSLSDDDLCQPSTEQPSLAVTTKPPRNEPQQFSVQ